MDIEHHFQRILKTEHHRTVTAKTSRYSGFVGNRILLCLDSDLLRTAGDLPSPDKNGVILFHWAVELSSYPCKVINECNKSPRMRLI